MPKLLLLIAFTLLSLGTISAEEEFAAKVNDEIISKESFNLAVDVTAKQMSEHDQLNLHSEEGQLAFLETRKTILDEMVNNLLLVQAAKRMKIFVSESEIDTKIEALRKSFPSQKVFEEALAEEGLIAGDLRKGILQQILHEKITDALTKEIKISDREVSRYYKTHPSQFFQPQKVQTSHILVEDRSVAEDIMKKLSQGESFAKLAKQYSIDPLSSGNGGDLGFIEPDQMPKEFDRVLFHMKPGDISSIIRTDFGFHIIKCGEIIPPKKIATETTTEKIRNFLRQERQRDLFDRWFERIKNDARVEINPDVFPTTPGLKTKPTLPKGKNNLQSRYDG